MELLGIVWAASIITPSAITASATEMIGRRTQPLAPIPIEATAPWLTSLADVCGWAMPKFETEGGCAHPMAISTQALIPDLNLLDDLEVKDTATKEVVFQALVPHISTELDSLEQVLEVSPATAEDNNNLMTEPEVSNKWHSWMSVASVQVSDRDDDISTEDGVPQGPDPICLRDAAAPYQESPLAMKTSSKRQLWVNNQFIGDVNGQVTAQKIAQKLRSLIQANAIEAARIQPLIGTNFVGATHGSDILFVVDETMRSHPEVPATTIAVQWINNLRSAFGERPLGLAEIQMAIAGLAETSESFYGTASWYGPGFHGRKTANGEIFDENSLTAAHKTLPFNTQLKITNRLNGQSVVVRINDRGPYIGQRSLDLSKAAAHCLGSTRTGVVPYEAVILTPVEQPTLADMTTAQLTDGGQSRDD